MGKFFKATSGFKPSPGEKANRMLNSVLPLAKTSTGFTLIEILIVVVIITILASLAFTSFSQIQRSSRDSQRKSDLEEISGALTRFNSDNAAFPVSDAAGQIGFNSGDCSSTSPSYIAWGTGIFNCNGVSYLRQLPADPLGNSYPEYCYVQTSTNSFELYADLEGNGNIPNTNFCSWDEYNYRVTQTD